MVTFTCSTCGDSIRKNAVEKHGYRCQFDVITCIDCFQEFTRSSYVAHNQCMTENERYQGNLYAGKESENKGQKKQDNWLQNIQDYVSTGKAGPASHQVQKLLGYPNIPRKKNKFVNFVTNCMSVRNPQDIERIWAVIEAANAASRNELQRQETKLQPSGTKRMISEDEPAKKHMEKATDKKRIRKGVEGENEKESTSQSDPANQVSCEEKDIDDIDLGLNARVVASCSEKLNDVTQASGNKFSWKKTIERLVTSAHEKEMKLKRLKRQAYSVYKSSTAKESRISKQEAYENVMKYASKSRRLKLHDEVVSEVFEVEK